MIRFARLICLSGLLVLSAAQWAQSPNVGLSVKSTSATPGLRSALSDKWFVHAGVGFYTIRGPLQSYREYPNVEADRVKTAAFNLTPISGSLMVRRNVKAFNENTSLGLEAELNIGMTIASNSASEDVFFGKVLRLMPMLSSGYHASQYTRKDVGFSFGVGAFWFSGAKYRTELFGSNKFSPFSEAAGHQRWRVRPAGTFAYKWARQGEGVYHNGRSLALTYSPGNSDSGLNDEIIRYNGIFMITFSSVIFYD